MQVSTLSSAARLKPRAVRVTKTLPSPQQLDLDTVAPPRVPQDVASDQPVSELSRYALAVQLNQAQETGRFEPEESPPGEGERPGLFLWPQSRDIRFVC